jgi:hypothetical protein
MEFLFRISLGQPPTQTSGRVGEEPMTTKPPNLLGSFSARTK